MDIPNVSPTSYLLVCFDKYPDNIALVEHDTERSITYRELKKQVIQAANGFIKQGIKYGDVVTILLPNMLEYPIIVYALSAIGAISQMTVPQIKPDGLKTQCEQNNTKYIITIPTLLDLVKAAHITGMKEIICLGEADGCVAWNSLLELGQGAEYKNLTFDLKTTTLCYFMSGGTTGLPKTVAISQYAFLVNTIQFRAMSTVHTDTMLIVLPLYHMFPLVCCLTSALPNGVRVIIMSKFNAETFMAAIQKYQVSIIIAVPPILVRLTKMAESMAYDLNCVRLVVCAASPLSLEIENKTIKLFKIGHVSQVYGTTEAMGISLNSALDNKPGSVGKPLEGIRVKVIDTINGKVLPPNTSGELCFTGDQISSGYPNNPEATTAMFDGEGWVKSGDLGYVDNDGFIFIVDRIKEMIKYNGRQIAPAELEAILLKHPDVVDTGVIGIADEIAGELPKAFVVLRKGSNSTAQVLQNFVKERTTPYNRLRGGIEFIQEIPKTASGKILRRSLKEGNYS